MRRSEHRDALLPVVPTLTNLPQRVAGGEDVIGWEAGGAELGDGEPKMPQLAGGEPTRM